MLHGVGNVLDDSTVFLYSPPPLIPLATIQAIIKPQYVDHIPKAVKGLVGEVLTDKDERGEKEELSKVLELEQVRGRGGV